RYSSKIASLDKITTAIYVLAALTAKGNAMKNFSRSLFALVLFAAVPLLAAPFQKGPEISSAWNPVIVDMNHDGRDDAIADRELFLNVNGTLVDSGALDLPSGVRAVDALDVDGDGKDDLILARGLSSTSSSTQLTFL